MQVIYDTAVQRVPIKAWVDGVEFDENARKQVLNVANLPFAFKHVAVMPDVHWGVGATVGSVIATKGAIVPAAVGVDIGCGMIALRTALRAEDLPDDLKPLRSAIEERVPHGRTDNGGPNDRGAWGSEEKMPVYVRMMCEMPGPQANLQGIMQKHPGVVPRDPSSISRQLGTLGTGNHFIEICLDEARAVWIMLHSGSRGVGNRIGTYFIEQAWKQAEKYGYATYLPDRDLAWLNDGTELFGDYWRAVAWAQDYAKMNREAMLVSVLQAMESIFPGRTITTDEVAVNCHHNYVAKESHFGQNVFVTRKGAVRAREGDLGIIPGSMGVKSFIVRGKGNAESFHSCSHGAGRRLGRKEATRQLTVADLEEQTRGVECRKDAGVLDEAPAAYKSIDAVIAAEADLIEVVHALKQVLCVKG